MLRCLGSKVSAVGICCKEEDEDEELFVTSDRDQRSRSAIEGFSDRHSNSTPKGRQETMGTPALLILLRIHLTHKYASESPICFFLSLFFRVFAAQIFCCTITV
ncbi:unnamed protein product [Ilex paraguariensis]|uniref:Uncharacterized protein n=1 Tax=Ilex paraguariensis TaxID=185542 RepID=A0ABC8U6W5_9AQUA